MHSEQDLQKFDVNRFRKNVKCLMEQYQLSFPALSKHLGCAGVKIAENNMATYINKRNPSINLVVALSKIFSVSVDYLLFNAEDETSNNMSLEHVNQMYEKYKGNLFLYYHSTDRNCDSGSLIKGNIEIKKDEVTQKYLTHLSIPVGNTGIKQYTGTFFISRTSRNAFIRMDAKDFDEQFEIIFNAPMLNIMDFKIAMGAVVSLSSGGLSKLPTMHKVCITREVIPEEKERVLQAHLKLNKKYIDISDENINEVLKHIFIKHELPDVDYQIAKKMIENAFEIEQYRSIEERYLRNTFSKKTNISANIIQELVIEMRLKSLAETNIKINPIVDEYLYDLIYNDNKATN